MEKTITADMTAVCKRVRTMSEYIGAKLLGKDPAAYERISAIEADDEMLSGMVPGLMSKLSGSLACHSLGFTISGTTITLALELSKGHTGALLPAMAEDMKSYLVCSLLSEWLKIVLPGAENEYGGMAEAHAESLRRNTSCKSKPI